MSIVISNLRKKYGQKEVLKGLNYTFKDNQHYLIKGENGIGKSTLIKSIMRQIKFEGECQVLGRIAYAPEDPILPSFMTVYSFIKTFSTITNDIDDIDKVIGEELKNYNLVGYEKKQMGSLSKGEKMKVNIIQALIAPSEILILDEPLSGLDTESKKVLLKRIKEDRRLIIVISHETIAFRKSNFTMLRIKDGEIYENL